LRRVLLAFVLLTFMVPAAGRAQETLSTIAGRVVDASTGLALGGVKVESIGPTARSGTTDSNGRFSLSGLAPGIYQLRLAINGYQTTLSDSFPTLANSTANVTLSISRQQTGSETLRTIARTSTHASQSLQRSSVIYKQESAEAIEAKGIYRIGDFLRTLPQVNLNAATGGSDTPSPGDDQYLDVRGIGGLETVALIDGHPIGFGINRGKNLGYNWEISPTFALRSVQVTYGSGVAGLTPYSAVGGTIDMLTLEPTPQQEVTLTQGYGTYQKLVSALTATGTISKRFGYALAAGIQGIDGPYKNDYFFQPASSFDPSAPTNTPEYRSGIYQDDTSVVNRGYFGKLRYYFGDSSNAPRITFSALAAYYWDNKTGNGDQDFLPYDTALALGNTSLASYAPGTSYAIGSKSVTTNCPAGQFTALNLSGTPWGYGPNAQPDGGKPCVTPQQYARYASGFQGAGPTWQAFEIGDYDLDYGASVGNTDLEVSTYTNRFNQIYDRTFELPYVVTNGAFGLNPFWLQPQVTTTGASVTDQYSGTNNDVGLGLAQNNYAYLFLSNGVQQPSPIVHDDTAYMQDVFHPVNARYNLYVNAAETHSTITNSYSFDPRVALVYDLPGHNVVRVASGVTTVQPYATYIDLPYSPIAFGALNGNLNCTGLTTIGQVADPSLQPERASDEEVSIGHRFGSDSIVQLEAYNENVNDKIYSTIIPAGGLPAGIIPSATLNQFATAINAACGTSGLKGVGVNSEANVGRMLAQGIDLSGRQRFTHRFFVDYDYSIESSQLRSADKTTLENNLVLIVGSQLPGVPLHKASAALDYTFGDNIDVRVQQYWVSANNSKNSPAYNYGDLTVGVPLLQNGTLNIAVSNAFNQFVQYNGLIGHGVPLALNQYATATNYQPLIGAAATELYGLPYRQIFFGYTYRLKSL
jgi:outer membrane receptor for ferrienterochelin and colicin